MAARVGMLRQARGRGSVSPEGMKMLAAAQEESPQLAVLENTEVQYAIWHADRAQVQEQSWRQRGGGGELDGSGEEEEAEKGDEDEGGGNEGEAAGEGGALAKGCWEVYFTDGEVGYFDRVWLATGSVLDVTRDPLLGPFLQRCDIPTEGGLPIIEPSLRWRPGCELYVMGHFAALRLGPDALNLAGAKTGACRIDAGIRNAIRSASGSGGADEDEDDEDGAEHAAAVPAAVPVAAPAAVAAAVPTADDISKLAGGASPPPPPPPSHCTDAAASTTSTNSAAKAAASPDSAAQAEVAAGSAANAGLGAESRCIDSVGVRLNKSGWCSVTIRYAASADGDEPWAEIRSNKGSKLA